MEPGCSPWVVAACESHGVDDDVADRRSKTATAPYQTTPYHVTRDRLRQIKTRAMNDARLETACRE